MTGQPDQSQTPRPNTPKPAADRSLRIAQNFLAGLISGGAIIAIVWFITTRSPDSSTLEITPREADNSQTATDRDPAASQQAEEIAAIRALAEALQAQNQTLREALDQSLQDTAQDRAALREALEQPVAAVPSQPIEAPQLVPAETTPQPANAFSTRINVNTANASELDALPGIGPAFAERIINERQNGAFKGLQDLQERVSGIGVRTAERLAPYVRFD